MLTKSNVALAATATGLCVVGVLLTSCQASSAGTSSAGAPASGAATSTTAAPGQGTTSGGTTATGPASGSGATATSGSGDNSSNSGGNPSCTSSQLKATTSYDAAQNSGGTLIAFLVLTNTSTSTCTLDGYSGVDFLNPSGSSLGMSTQRVPGSNAAPEKVQTVAPGKSASEEITFAFAANDQGNGCENAGTISVIPPNQTQSLHTQLTSVKTGTIPFFGVCGNTITVFPIVPADQIPN